MYASDQPLEPRLKLDNAGPVGLHFFGFSAKALGSGLQPLKALPMLQRNPHRHDERQHKTDKLWLVNWGVHYKSGTDTAICYYMNLN